MVRVGQALTSDAPGASILILRFGDSIQPTTSLAPILLKFYLPIAVRPGLAFETWDWESVGGPGAPWGEWHGRG